MTSLDAFENRLTQDWRACRINGRWCYDQGTMRGYPVGSTLRLPGTSPFHPGVVTRWPPLSEGAVAAFLKRATCNQSLDAADR